MYPALNIHNLNPNMKETKTMNKSDMPTGAKVIKTTAYTVAYTGAVVTIGACFFCLYVLFKIAQAVL